MTSDQLLHQVIEIANGIIPFSRHRVLLSWGGRRPTDKLWNVRTGELPAEMQNSEVPEYCKAAARARKRKTPTARVTVDGMRAAAAPVEISPLLRVTIFLIRRDPFSNQELQLLQTVARLFQAAAIDPDIGQVLHRLYVMFLQSQSLENTMDSQEILENAIKKVGFVAHPEWYDPLEPLNRSEHRKKADPKRARVRMTAKLVTPNQTAMWIAASDAMPNRSEWTAKRKRTQYFLEQKDSIAAHVFDTRKAYVSNDYQNDPLAKKTFNDLKNERDYSKSHISVPILMRQDKRGYSQEKNDGDSSPTPVLPFSECLGVLSVETSKKNAYDPCVVWALELFGARLAWPLSRSLLREELDRKEKEAKLVADTIRELRECGEWKEIEQLVDNCLRELKYDRTLYCSVDYQSRMVKGEWTRGGGGFGSLKKATELRFETDSTDCQVLAVTSGIEQIIVAPKRDPRVNPRSVELAKLKPFGVFPFVDSHGRVRRTVHIERTDLSPIGPRDVELVRNLCSAAVDRWERVKLTNIESDWGEVLLTEQFTTPEQLLRRFSDFVCDKRLVRRARVYEISRDYHVGVSQSGTDQVDDFTGFKLNEQSRELFETTLSHRQLALVVYRQLAHDRRGSRDIHVVPTEKMPHKQRLKKAGVPEWVEIPIVSDELEHNFKVCVDNKGRPKSRFTTPELRTLAALARMTTLAVLDIAENHLRGELAIAGLNGHVLRHGTQDVLTKMILEIEGLPEQERLMPVLQDSLTRLREVKELSRGKKKGATSQTPEGATTVLEELQRVERILGHWVGMVDLKYANRGLRVRVDARGNRLCWVLLTLLMNSLAAIDKVNYKRGWIKVGSKSTKRKIVLEVKDNGCGISEELAILLKGNPRKVRSSSGDGLGYAYARLLAVESGWELSLAKRGNPTIFRLEIPKQSAR